MTPRWKFKPFQDGDTQRDPVAGDFFSQDAIENIAEALIRESIQNSLDAAENGGTVRIRIRAITDLGRTGQREALSFLEELRPHVTADRNGLLGPPRLESLDRVIVLEDFGTSGLLGDEMAAVPDEETKNDFFAFFRAEGYTQKGADERGKWGVGKTVFPRASRINTLFGLTIRADDPRPLLMGRSILKTHSASGQRWHPDGYYGEPSDSGLVHAITDRHLIHRFRETFDLERSIEPGLSVIVPFAEPEIDALSILRACVRDYFIPVQRGRLIVSVIGDALNDRWELNRESLLAICGELGDKLSSSDRRLVELGHWATEESSVELMDLPAPPADQSPKMERVPLPDEQIATLREKFARHEQIALRQHVVIRPVDGESEEGSFAAYLRPIDPADRIPPVFVREGVVVSNAGGKGPKGYVSLVLIDDGPLARLLGASENVAHTEWNKDRSGFKETYRNAVGYLEFVKKGLSELHALVMSTDSERDPDLLRAVFSIAVDPDPDLDEADEAGPRRRGKGVVSPPGGAGPARIARYRIGRAADGFSVRPGDPGAAPITGLRIRAAYDVRRGNPLKKYVETDFDFGAPPIQVSVESGATILSAEKNTLSLSITDLDFAVRVTGFDTNRDLFVKADVLEEAFDDRP